MPTPRKYTGPCELHPLFTRACKHCTAWAARMRRTGGPQVLRAKRMGTTGKTWKVRRRLLLRLDPVRLERYRRAREVDGVLYAAALMRMRNEINSLSSEAA